MNTWTESVMRVGATYESNTFIEVTPDGDGLGMVQILCSNAKSKEYFGDINFTLNTEMARAVAAAIISVANAIDSTARAKQ